MKQSIKSIATIALLSALSHSAVADNRVPADLAETISPNYRSGDMRSHAGSKFVWVKRIEGRDSQGNTHLLFSDLQGALLPIEKLSMAGELINPLKVQLKGNYQGITLQLADSMLNIDKRGMKRLSLPTDMATDVLLHGELVINQFEVSSNELTLLPSAAKSVALLER